MNEIKQKQCKKCGEIKSLACFSKKPHGKYGLSSWCKECHCSFEKSARGHGITDVDLLTDKQKKVRKKRTEMQKEIYKKNPKKTILVNAKKRAAYKNLEFNITEDDICINEICPVFGIIIERSDKRQKYNSPSLDRLDSSKGYTKDNINIISFRANFIKGNATFEEFEAIYKWWKSELKKRKKKIDRKLLKVNTGETNVIP